MSQLFFKREFFTAIEDGSKTTTLRRWTSPRVKAGGRAYVPGLGWLRIMACQRVGLRSLKSADARADGFSSMGELRRTLRRLYPEHGQDGRQWYRVVFELEVSQTSAAEKERALYAGGGNLDGGARWRLARRIRTKLDKAVERSGSLFPL